MSQYVADTHAQYWHLANDPRLSAAARAVLLEADWNVHLVFVPGIALVEMVYLVERGRLAPELLDRLLDLLYPDDGSYRVAALDPATVEALREVPRAAVPDMPDRIIVATALRLGLPLVSRDGAIRRAGVVLVVW